MGVASSIMFQVLPASKNSCWETVFGGGGGPMVMTLGRIENRVAEVVNARLGFAHH